MAETVNGYYKAELIRGPARPGPWKTVEEVEIATLGWVHWHNTQRLHGYLDDIPPVEFEALHAANDALNPPNPGDLMVTDTAGIAADRLPQPRPESLEDQIGPDTVAHGLSAQPPRPAWPPAPPGSATIMCGSPGSGFQRRRRHPKASE